MSPLAAVTKEARGPAAPAIAGSSGHNAALDGVRGMAILLVMWHHMTKFHPASRVEQWYASLASLGQTGVDLFFVLSGFLITGILYDSKQKIVGRGEGAGRYFGNFYARRTLRIFPLYYAVVALSLLVLPHVGGLLAHVVSAEKAALIGAKLDRFEQVKGYSAWFWLYLSNFPVAYKCNWLHGILGISWSLAIEEQFYLAWPMLVWFADRRRAIRVCGAIVVIALVCRCVLVGRLLAYGYTTEPRLPWANPVGPYVLTFCRIDALALGALCALVLRGSVDLDRAARVARSAVWVCGPGALLLVWLDVRMGWNDPGNGDAYGPLFQTIGYTLTGMTCLSVLVLAVASRPGGTWHGFWASRGMRTFGKYAYALYLFHLPIRAVIRDMAFGPRPDGGVGGGPRVPFFHVLGSELPAQIVFYVVATAATLAVAWVSWMVFESRILKLKRHFPSGIEGP